jgi:twitching motility protein PilI
VESAGTKYLFPLAQSGEIFPFVSAQPVPYTQAWFLGVANLRGGLYGVVDLASFVGGHAPAIRSDATRAESRLVALNAMLEVNCALLIDRLAACAILTLSPPRASPQKARQAILAAAIPMPMARTGRKSTSRRCRNNPSFLSISA